MKYLGYKARFKIGDECRTMLGQAPGTVPGPDYSSYVPDDLALAALAAVEEYLVEIGAIDPPSDDQTD